MKSERAAEWRPSDSANAIRNQVRGEKTTVNSFPAHYRTPNDWPLLPWPRGELSGFVVSALQREPGTLGVAPGLTGVDALGDDDFGLALYLCYELHYRKLAEPLWQFDPQLLGFRREMERAFVDQLREEIARVAKRGSTDVTLALDELIQRSSKNLLSLYLTESGTLEQFRELCVHHSAYQLREADPSAYGMPGFADDATSTQTSDDAEGDIGAPSPSSLFGDTMVALGLDPSYGSYVENLPGVTLALVNLTSMFSVERKWRAALVGHIAVSDMTSSEPMYRYGQALIRFGVNWEGRRFYCMEANVGARHTAIARDRLVAGLIDSVPHLEADLLFGAAALLLLEERFEKHLLDAWSQNRTSLVPWPVVDR